MINTFCISNNDLRSVETEFPTIVFNDALTSEVALLCEPTVSSLNDNQIDFRISFDESDDEDYTTVYTAYPNPMDMTYQYGISRGLELTQTYGGSGSTNTGGTVVPEILDVRIQSEYDFFKPANLHEASQHGPVHWDKCPKARNQQNDGARAELSGGENPQQYPNCERPEKDLGSLACIKADEKKLDDIRIVRDFPEGSPSENVRIVEPAQELQKKVLFDQVTSPWGAPVLLSRRRMVRVASPS
ncbi:hypothetical protein Tco_0320121 [Tanacetum coccineum]